MRSVYEVILPLIAVLVSLAGILGKYYKSISSMKERLTRLETKMELFWKIVENNVGRLLKSPRQPRKDELLDKLSGNSLNREEAAELKEILEREFAKKGKRSQLSLAYILALGRLEQVLFDLGGSSG